MAHDNPARFITLVEAILAETNQTTLSLRNSNRPQPHLPPIQWSTGRTRTDAQRQKEKALVCAAVDALVQFYYEY